MVAHQEGSTQVNSHKARISPCSKSFQLMDLPYYLAKSLAYAPSIHQLCGTIKQRLWIALVTY